MSDFAEVKKILEGKLKELDVRAQGIDEDLSETADDDWSENATDAEGDEVLEKMGGMALNTISKIKSALAKIESGSYGNCTKCNIKINPKRLAALPYATTCVKCSG